MSDSRRPSDPFTTDPELLEGPALRADGIVEGKPAPEPSQEPGPRPSTPDAPLELVSRPPPRVSTAPMAYRPEPVTRRPALVASLIVMVLAGIAVGAWAMVAKPKVLRAPVVELPGPLRDVLPELNGPPVVIESEPPGASIQSAAGTLGVTPWAGNNPFLNDTELTLTLKGHQPKKVKLPGAKEAHLTVTLKRVSR